MHNHEGNTNTPYKNWRFLRRLLLSFVNKRFFLACQKITDVSNSNTVAREELKKEKGEGSIELFYQKEFRVILSCSLESKDKDIRLTSFKFSCKLISAGKKHGMENLFFCC